MVRAYFRLSRLSSLGAAIGQTLIVLTLVILLAGCQAHTNARLEHGSAPHVFADQTEYRLGTDDRLRIIVFGQDDLSNIYTVDPSGQISMPLIGAVDVAGLSTVEVESRIGDSLRSGFIRNPNVSVEVQTYRPFYILGQVGQPGQYAFASGLTITSAVAIAGGYTDRGAKRRAFVTRTIGAETYRAPVRIDTIVMPGDTIEIPERLF